MVDTLSEILGLHVLHSSQVPAAPLLEEQLPISFLKQSKILPISFDEHTIKLAVTNPFDVFSIKLAERKSNKSAQLLIATPTMLDSVISDIYTSSNKAGEPESKTVIHEEDLEKLRDIAQEAPVKNYLNKIITEALKLGASDIHLEPDEHRLNIRFRVDGSLRQTDLSSTMYRNAIVSRLKILSNLDIAERRLPQDGRMSLITQGTELDIRVSTIPMHHGEGVVLRLLDHSKTLSNLHELGFSQSDAARLVSLLKMPNGIILITGPTGSGKTTTLYAGLGTLDHDHNKIITVEDPIEYQMAGISQIQTHSEIGLDFASVLRSVLRHDPDIIMIGEIRDLETAKIAVQAALTGHLVISTLHTNSALSAVTRLQDMGIDNYLIASTLKGVLAQRLVRKLCENCKNPTTDQDIVKGSGKPAFEHHPSGCEQCGHTGYSGRTVIHELLEVNEDIQSVIIKGGSLEKLRAAASLNQFKPLQEAGFDKANQGITSLEEIYRVTNEV